MFCHRLPKTSTLNTFSRPFVKRKCLKVWLNSSTTDAVNVRQNVSDIQNGEYSQPFAGSRRGEFFQNPPVLGNQFTRDSHLKACLKRILPGEVSRVVYWDNMTYFV